jgi:hypothetical protein
LFTTNYQATYNYPTNTQDLARVTMKKGECLRDYSNCFFENRNQLADVKDQDVIIYYKNGVTTIADLMSYVDKLVDTQDVVVRDFKGNKVDDAFICMGILRCYQVAQAV